jgi:2-dehydropantoate 2-reductase
MVRECIAVGRAAGATLDDSIVEAVVDGARNAPADSINSLLADRMAGRPMEIDARNGAVVRLGRKHGIPTPLNEMAVALLVAAQDARSFRA